MTVQSLPLIKGKYLASHYGALRQGAAQAIATGVTDSFDFDVSEFDNFTVLVSMTGAASADLVVAVQPIAIDGEVLPIPLVPAVTPAGPTFVTPDVYYCGQFDTHGLDQIRVTVKNANAGGQTINFVDVIAGWTGSDF
jgi:hypothetical protein